MRFLHFATIFLLTIFSISTVSVSLPAQDEKSPSPLDDSAKTDKADTKLKGEEVKLVYTELKTEWEKTNTRFEELETQFNEEKDPVKKAEIKKQFSSLITTSKTLGENLRTAALKEYEDKPNENEEITRLLVGMIVNDVAFGRYDEAKAIADALISGKADEKHFLAFRDAARITIGDRAILESFIEKRQEADNSSENGEKEKSVESEGKGKGSGEEKSVDTPDEKKAE